MTEAGELRAALDALRAKLDENFSGMRNLLDDKATSLRTLIDETEEAISKQNVAIAHIESTIRSVKWIGTAAVVVCAILGALGVNKLVSDAKDIQNGILIIKGAALSTQESLVDRLELEFAQLTSLDEFSARPDLTSRISALSMKIQEISWTVDEQNRSTYYLVGEALNYFIANDCEGVISKLDRVKESDRNRFTYAYMRAACLLRENKRAEAQIWLSRAAGMSADRRSLMARNAATLNSLYFARQQHNLDLVGEAIENFKRITKDDKNFYAAYINIACAYATLEKFDEVTNFLKKARVARNSDEVVASIHNDLDRPSDRFFEKYVRDYLKVRESTSDSEWKGKILAALHF